MACVQGNDTEVTNNLELMFLNTPLSLFTFLWVLLANLAPEVLWRGRSRRGHGCVRNKIGIINFWSQILNKFLFHHFQSEKRERGRFSHQIRWFVPNTLGAFLLWHRLRCRYCASTRQCCVWPPFLEAKTGEDKSAYVQPCVFRLGCW